MLVLTRKPGESILVGDDIQITFLGHSQNKSIRIGVLAPAEISVDREEVRRRKEDRQQQRHQSRRQRQ